MTPISLKEAQKRKLLSMCKVFFTEYKNIILISGDIFIWTKSFDIKKNTLV